MIAAQASSRALVVSMQPASHIDLCIALALGFAPAVLIGMPGLIGLAAAIAARIVFVVCLRHKHRTVAAGNSIRRSKRPSSCLYLGTLAAWAYIMSRPAWRRAG